RFSRDWSSDVCSSDLGGGRVQLPDELGDRHAGDELASLDDLPLATARVLNDHALDEVAVATNLNHVGVGANLTAPLLDLLAEGEIGRASCRERVKVYV